MTFAKLFVLAAASAILATATAAGGRADDPEDEKPSRLGRAPGGGAGALPNCEGATIPVAARTVYNLAGSSVVTPGECRKCTSEDLDARDTDGTAMYPQCVLTAKAKRVAKRVADRRAERKEKRVAARAAKAKADRVAARAAKAKADRVAARAAKAKADRVAARAAKAKADRVAARQAEKAWKGYGYTLVNSGTCGDAGAEIVTTAAECAYASNFRSAGNTYQQDSANVGTESWHFGRPLNCMYGGGRYTWHDPDSIHSVRGPHPNALCGSDGGSGTPFACICRVKLPPPHDGPPEPLSNHVVYNGHVYGTLANAAVDGFNGVWELCQQEYLPVPKGCRLAPNTEEILNNVVKGHTWSTYSLLLPDAEIGSLVGSIQYFSVTARQTGSKGTLARDGANLYKPSTGCMQILYECVV